MATSMPMAPPIEEYAEEIARDSNLVCQISDYVSTAARVPSAFYFIRRTDFGGCQEDPKR